MGGHTDPNPARPVSDSSTPIRVLLLADSHLGFDLPIRPRVKRRRRGHDFLANHELALEPAREGRADLVVHGGDVFHRSRVPASLVFQAFRSLVEIAESGVPVFVVPGNHERSRIPHDRFAAHPNLHIFRRPETRVVVVGNVRVALSGFPYERRKIRERFRQVLEETGWRREETDVHLLCIHHCVEGATVGPVDYTFRHSPDVIRCSDLPREFAAVLSGHIHRHQVLRQDLDGRPLPTPVLYPGSVDRTAFAEMDEEKGFMLLEVAPDDDGGTLVRHEFVSLPARNMVVRDLKPGAGHGTAWAPDDLAAQLNATLAAVPMDAILRVRVHGQVGPEGRLVLASSRLRDLSPSEMNLGVNILEDRAQNRTDIRQAHRRSYRRAHEETEASRSSAQLGMDLFGVG